MTDNTAAIIGLIAALAPDRGAAVTVQSELVDDLGYDSPRKLELVVSLERLLDTALTEPPTRLVSVADVLTWVEDNASSASNARAGSSSGQTATANP